MFGWKRIIDQERERKSHKNQRYQNEIQILFFEKGKLTRSNWHEKNWIWDRTHSMVLFQTNTVGPTKVGWKLKFLKSPKKKKLLTNIIGKKRPTSKKSRVQILKIWTWNILHLTQLSRVLTSFWLDFALGWWLLHQYSDILHPFHL